jgi:hypothetical protein
MQARGIVTPNSADGMRVAPPGAARRSLVCEGNASTGESWQRNGRQRRRGKSAAAQQRRYLATGAYRNRSQIRLLTIPSRY